MVPIFLSLLVSLPFLFLIVPGGSPCFFSKVPTVQSDLVFLMLHHRLSIADPTNVILLKICMQFPCNIKYFSQIIFHFVYQPFLKNTLLHKLSCLIIIASAHYVDRRSANTYMQLLFTQC